MQATYVSTGRQTQTDFGVNFSTTIDIGAGPNTTILGWLKTVHVGERPNTLTIGGQSATVGPVVARATANGEVGFMRKFKFVNTNLTGNQTFICAKVDDNGSPYSISNMQIDYIVYNNAISISSEVDTPTQAGASQSTTITSPTGEVAVWAAQSNAAQNSGSPISATGSAGTTVRGGSYTYAGATMFAEENGAGSTTLNFTITNSFSPTTYGVVYSLSSGASGTAPSITTQPANQTVTAGATATFSVVATGTGTLSYQWQRNPNGNTSFSNISGATSSSYTTPATTLTGGSANNTDTYRVIVTGDTSPAATSNATTLTVTAAATAPTVSTPSNQTVIAGATATFSVTATGSGTLTYQWQRNPTGATTFADISGATSSSYTTPITTVSGGSANNTDTYRVIVTGDTAPAATSGAALLTVNPAPTNIPFTARPPYVKG